MKENNNHFLKKIIFKKYIESNKSEFIDDDVLSSISPASPVDSVFHFGESWHERQDRQWAKDEDKKMERDK